MLPTFTVKSLAQVTFGDSSLKVNILFTQDFFQIFIPDDPKEIQVESQNFSGTMTLDYWNEYPKKRPQYDRI